MASVSTISLALTQLLLFISALVMQINLIKIIKTKHCGMLFGVRNLVMASLGMAIGAIIFGYVVMRGFWDTRLSICYHICQFMAIYSLTDYCLRSYSENSVIIKLYSLAFPCISLLGVYYIGTIMSISGLRLERGTFSLAQLISLFIGGSGRLRVLYRNLSKIYMICLLIPCIICCATRFSVLFKEAFGVIIITTLCVIFWSALYISPSYDAETVHWFILFTTLQIIICFYINTHILKPRLVVLKNGSFDVLSMEASHDR